ncbi:MAG: fumarylacetoacetate hydrolase family protein [Gordonia sp. (in: high G+C Gram-positive bacteria)]|uniref:fumarylacetoacetate hydrolase family protein n=1 Tax=Gordonia sp. (in: high G+C Gram-positive bacteria) TaxID=84139 RepID=UPI0039E4D999
MRDQTGSTASAEPCRAEHRAQIRTGEAWQAIEQLDWQSLFRPEFELERYASMPDGGPQRSKHFATSMSSTAIIGPDVIEGLDRLTATVTIDGEVVSETGTQGMRYSLGEAIAHCLQGEQLFPGELFSTGTLPGGSGMELGRWLAPGQTLRLEIDGVGVIEHLIGGEA